MRKIFFVLLLAAAQLTFAAESTFTPSSSYDPKVPTVSSVLGYGVGEAFTHYFALIDYFQKVDAASDRVTLQPYGKSVEGRTLYTIVITSPGNMQRLEQVRAAIARLGDPRQTPPEEAQRMAADLPVIVWLSYNVHGNEAVSSEAALQVVYELAASQDQRVVEWLDKAVIVIDPIVNPDGRERYVSGYEQRVGAYPRADRFAAEHQEPWPGGRANHYLFDLNRDWAWQSQPESVARIKAYRTWNPQVHVDFHEMGAESTYFLGPPAKPMLQSVAPLLEKWFDMYGKGNAAAFDKYGFRYFSRESYDLFYPGYGDSWPSLSGAIGMTYEQAGGGQSGLVIQLPEQQRTLTLKDRATRHFVSSLSTIDTSVKNKEARLRDWYAFRKAAIDTAHTGPFQAAYLLPGKDPERALYLVTVLARQGIEVRRADKEFDAEDLTNYWGEKAARKHFPAGTYVVDMAQPAGFLARALLEREAKLEGIPTFFYDVTGWTLPLAAGVDAYLSGRPAPAGFPAVASLDPPQGSFENVENAVAYVFSWEQSAAQRMLAMLLDQDVKAYVSIRPFKLRGQEYPAGSIVVPTEVNGPDLAQKVKAAAEKSRCQVRAVPTLLAEEGIDLGSQRVRFLRKPRVAILMDTPTASTDYGALWFLFEQRLGMPFTPLRTEALGGVDLNQYNVLILPADSGDGRGYGRYLDKALTTRLQDWVRAGGILIASRGGAIWASKRKSGLTNVTYRYVRSEDEEARQQEEKDSGAAPERPSGASPAPAQPPRDAAKPEPKKDAKDTKVQAPAAEPKPEPQDPKLAKLLTKWADRGERIREEEIPGTILRVKLDPTHPIGFGLPEEFAVLDRTAPILDLDTKGENVVYFPKEPLKLSGFITPENEKKLANTAFVVREGMGRGSVILFADSPVFRGFWEGTSRMLVNAVFFGNVRDPFLD